MAEPAATMQRHAPLRVAVIVTDPDSRAKLAARVLALGHVVSDVADADVVLADTDVSTSDLPAVFLGGVAADAAGLLRADADDAQLDAALRAVAAGLTVRAPIPESTGRETSFEALEESEPATLLTPREIEVLVGLSEGLSNKAVARRLDISQHTVKFHVESIFRKLSVTTRAEAVAKGLRRGWVHL